MSRPVRQIVVSRNVSGVVRVLENERVRSGIGVDELTQRACISKETYYHWVEGRSSPKLCALEDIARVMGLRICVRRREV